MQGPSVCLKIGLEGISVMMIMFWTSMFGGNGPKGITIVNDHMLLKWAFLACRLHGRNQINT